MKEIVKIKTIKFVMHYWITIDNYQSNIDKIIEINSSLYH